MGCDECEKANKEGQVYYYRFGAATIGIICCEKHFREIRGVLMGGEEKLHDEDEHTVGP